MIYMLAAGGAKESKLEWHSATVVDAQQQHWAEGPGAAADRGGAINLSRDQVDLDDGEAVWVAERTVVRSESWRPQPALKVEFAVDGKKVFIRGPGIRKTIEMKLLGRYPLRHP